MKAIASSFAMEAWKYAVDSAVRHPILRLIQTIMLLMLAAAVVVAIGVGSWFAWKTTLIMVGIGGLTIGGLIGYKLGRRFKQLIMPDKRFCHMVREQYEGNKEIVIILEEVPSGKTVVLTFPNDGMSLKAVFSQDSLGKGGPDKELVWAETGLYAKKWTRRDRN